MRDLAILLILCGMAWLAWWRPWIGVLGLAFLGGMHPQGYASGFMATFPVYMTLFVFVALAAARDFWRQRALPPLFFDWRLLLMVLLWGQFVLSTTQALNPWAAWPKMWEVAKLLPPLALTLLLIDSREKLRALNLAMALAIAMVVLKGGYWAVMTGFHDRVYGPPASQYGDNNEFAVATAMVIPLLALWYREVEQRGARVFLAVLIALSFAAALSSWSRGGLLSLTVVALLLVWHSRRKWLALPLLGAFAALMLVSLPEEWFARMTAFGTGQLDASAESRIEVWRLGWSQAQAHPWFGGGFQGWVYLSLPTGAPMDWHSAYVEIAAEHGLLGLGIWLSLLFGSMAALTRLVWYGRRWHLPWLGPHAAMLRASLAAYVVGSAFLGIAYWDLLYLFIVSTILLERFARLSRLRSSDDPDGVGSGSPSVMRSSV